MTSETAHECESWQERRAPDGTRYCAGCGHPARPEGPQTWGAAVIIEDNGGTK